MTSTSLRFDDGMAWLSCAQHVVDAQRGHAPEGASRQRC
jgi:hypothetical protein